MAKRIYQIKITLKGIRPPIWRRLLVDGAIRLNELSPVLLLTMGWDNSHLHAFQVGDRTYGELDPDYGNDWTLDERKVKLQDIAPIVGDKFRYDYDFGDSWEHEVLVEKILPPEPNAKYPRCIKGKRACPPEDCGGIWGYADLIEIMANPKDKQYKRMKEWLGDDLDPEAFDLEAINEALSSELENFYGA